MIIIILFYNYKEILVFLFLWTNLCKVSFGVMDLATPYLYANKIVAIKWLNKFLLKGSLNLSGSRGEIDR